MTYHSFSDHLDQIAAEARRSSEMLHLTANENALSDAARSMLTCSLHGRYHLGHVNKREYRRAGVSALGLTSTSLPAMHDLEVEATSAAKHLFAARHVDLRSISGLHAIIVTVSALTRKDDLVYCLHPTQGGHFATTSVIQKLGRRACYLDWDDARSDLELNGIERAFRSERPDLIYLDHSNCLFPLNLAGLRRLAGDDVVMVYDASHPLGLIAGGAFPNPLQSGCDVLQGNTHKTFPGPQKACIASNDEAVFQRISDTMDVMLSSQHSGDTLALYMTMLEMRAFGASYAEQTVRNAQHLGRCMRDDGLNVFNVQGRETGTHQLYLQGFRDNGHLSATEDLLTCGLSVNAKRSMNTDVIRIGVQEATRKGLVEEHMAAISKVVSACILRGGASAPLRSAVADLVAQASSVRYSFDGRDGACPETGTPS